MRENNVTPSITATIEPTREPTQIIEPTLLPTPTSTPIPELVWDSIEMVVNGEPLRKVVHTEICSSQCPSEEIEDLLGDIEEWKIVKDTSNLYFHSGSGSLGEEFLLLYKKNLLKVGDNIYLRDSITEKRYIITEVLELDRKSVSENGLFLFENNYEDQLVLITCSERNTPWTKFTSKLIIQLKPDIDPEG